MKRTGFKNFNRILTMVMVISLMLCTLSGCTVNDTTYEDNTVESEISAADTAAEDETTTADPNAEEVKTAEASPYEVESDGLCPDWRSNELNIIDDKYRTYYEIFVYSFCDSNGDGIGDLQGVISRLDYLNDGDPSTDADLGITGIWLTPIMPSPSYHKYDTADYMDVDPDFGSLQDMQTLLDECHARGINVIIDLAMNHTSGEHEWFKSAYEYLQSLPDGAEPDPKECPYVDYYNFSEEKLGGYSEVTDSDWYYESQFNYDMPDLNLHNEAVRDEFEEIADFWLDMGVDGFRLDAVRYYENGNDDFNIETLDWFNSYVKDQNPDAYIVCEDWADQTEYSRYYESGVDSMFDFEFADKDGIIAKTVNGKSTASAYGKALEAENELFDSYSEDYIDAPFYTNHDMGRSAGYYSGDDSEAQTKIAQAMNLLMSGNAFLYYGEEIGMKGSGRDENKRAPMYWSDDETDPEICDGPPEMETVKMKYAPLDEQMEDMTSIYSYVKDCIRLRNQIPAIARGTCSFMQDVSGDEVCVISKEYDGSSIYIAYNISGDTQQLDLSTLSSEPLEVLGELYAADTAAQRDGNVFTMPAWSVMVFEGEQGDTEETEYIPGYDTQKAFRERDTGSAGYINDRTVIVSLFVNEPEDVWSADEKNKVLETCRLAYDGLSDILSDKYDVETDLIYDWSENPDLMLEVRSNEEIPTDVDKEEEHHMDELEDEWTDEVDTAALLKKYEAQSIAFLYLIPHEGVSYSSMHFLEDDADTWNEGCLLYLQDKYSDGYDYETPTTYAHELLHLFGAEDLYSSAEVFSSSTYRKLKEICGDDLMYSVYDMIDGVYTIYHDGVHGTITPVTAYLLGIADESAVEDVPELMREKPGCFPGSAYDRPF